MWMRATGRRGLSRGWGSWEGRIIVTSSKKARRSKHIDISIHHIQDLQQWLKHLNYSEYPVTGYGHCPLATDLLVYRNLAGSLHGTVGYSPIGRYGPFRVDLGINMDDTLNLMKTVNG